MTSTSRLLLQQAVFIPDQDIYLKSCHQHDFVSHKWLSKNGIERFYALDGGTSYCRRVGDLDLKDTEVIDWCVYDTDTFETAAAKLLWGTRGVKGDQPLRYRPISSLTLTHLKAILKTQPQIKGTVVEKVIKHWIDLKS